MASIHIRSVVFNKMVYGFDFLKKWVSVVMLNILSRVVPVSTEAVTGHNLSPAAFSMRLQTQKLVTTWQYYNNSIEI